MKIVLPLIAILPWIQDPASSSHGTLVVLNKSDANVTLLDGESGATLATLPVGAGPHEAATSPDGRTVVVCNYGESTPGSSLTVIDTRTREVSSTIDLGEYQRPHGIAFLSDGRVVVTAEAQKKLLIVDLEARKVSAAIGTEQELSHMVALAPDGSRAYVANIGSGSISVIDLEKQELIRVVPTGEGAEGIAVHPESGAIWVTNRGADTVSVIAADTLEVQENVSCGSFPIRVAFTPDGSRALVSCAKADAVEVYDARTREKVAQVMMTATSVDDKEREGRLFGDEESAQAMPIGILVRPDGKVAYVANTMADRVTVIDLEKYAVLKRFTPGRQPDGMCWVR